MLLCSVELNVAACATVSFVTSIVVMYVRLNVYVVLTSNVSIKVIAVVIYFPSVQDECLIHNYQLLRVDMQASPNRKQNQYCNY